MSYFNHIRADFAHLTPLENFAVLTPFRAFAPKAAEFRLLPTHAVHTDHRSHHRRRSADVYIDISPFYGMAPATVSGYRLGGRCYA